MRGSDKTVRGTMTPTTQNNNTYPVGKYIVTPLTRCTDSGDYAASVSIRRGTYDRIFRFLPRFESHAGAEKYALAEGYSLLHTALTA